jgi:hypothetical protein
MLDLSRVTLLFVETRAHEITKRVIDDCLTKANFGDILIFSDQPERIPVPGARYELVPDFPNKRMAGQFYYGRAMEKVTTEFALMLEWDAGIFNAEKWRPEFFDYDYIGAPWMTNPAEYNKLDVGNGGFTLMSQKLGHFVCCNTRRFPVSTDWDFCRVQRKNFEAAGFKWPGRDLASLFAWELGPRNPDHFGYHGAFTWPMVLPKEEIVERARLMVKSPYLILKMKDLFRTAPWLTHELTAEEITAYTESLPPGYGLRSRLPGTMSPQQRAAAQLAAVQRRGFITRAQQTGEKA